MDVIGSMVILLIELLAVLGLLLWADRWLHRHLQGLMFLLTQDQELALWLYAIVLLPGVLLHELSHALVAVLVGVKIGRINILPQRAGKRIQLGFVPVQQTDFLRASLIGGAPLLFGSIVVVAVGYGVFATPELMGALSAGDLRTAFTLFVALLRAPDVWIWVYLIFAVSNTMLPSRSDVHAWPFLGFVVALIAGFIVFIGGASVLLDSVGRFLTVVVRWVILLGASTVLVDLPIFLLIYLAIKIVERFRGVRLEYK